MPGKKQQLYAVDDILSCKRVQGKFYYRIRWSGYGAADDTWEGRECFTAGSLSHFRPRMQALEQLLRDTAAGRKQQAAGAGMRQATRTNKRGSKATSSAASRSNAIQKRKAVKRKASKTK